MTPIHIKRKQKNKRNCVNMLNVVILWCDTLFRAFMPSAPALATPVFVYEQENN